ncbi:MAG TPA: hypothetical protein DCS36_00490 [Sphingobacterium sp.]|nr:hypothetical protein [Sphingobacterium sp.]HAL54732.1 hypothetical protein [Sphingobacterium sp.]HAT90898.1 hypothetical protein [Sphingobacterium sp.]HAU55948.1 hypothetical protein [Sphingobacterium sp.]HCX54994.1 hypothetical protein [Sphingobacterium sp.]
MLIEASDNSITYNFYKNTNCKWLYQCKDCIHFAQKIGLKTKNQVEKKDCYKKNKMLKVC